MYNEIYFKNKYLRYGIPIIFLLFIAYTFYSRMRLKSNYLISNAEVISVGKTKSKNGDLLVEYAFTSADGMQIEDEEFFPVYSSKEENLLQRSIPVAYSPTNPKKNQLLIYKQTWKQYGLKFPDSLVWLEDYIDFKKVIFSY